MRCTKSDSCRSMPRAACGGAQHDQRPLGRQDHLGGPVEGCRVRNRDVDRMRRHQRHVGSTSSPAMSSGSSRCTGPGRSSMATRNASRTMAGMRGGADDLAGHLGERLHGGDHVDDLEAGLAGGHDRLLAGDHDHRHGAEMGVGRARREVQRARARGRDAHAGLAGEAAVGRGHEGRGLLVPGEHQLDRGGAQASTTSRFSSPGTPKIRSTPSFSSAATSKSEPLGITFLSDGLRCPLSSLRSPDMNGYRV